MRARIHSILVQESDSIRSVMATIEGATHVLIEPPPAGIAIIVSGDGRLSGVVTDGDLRRALLKGDSLERPVVEVMNRDPITVAPGLPPAAIIRAVNEGLARRGLPGRKIDRIVVVGPDGRPEDVVSFYELWKESEVSARRVCVVGLGFVGLTLAVTFAEAGFEVVGVEKRETILSLLRAGKPQFHEKNLPALVKKHVGNRLTLSAALAKSMADIYVFCVGTPVNEESKTADYTHLDEAAREVGAIIKHGDLIILRSTVPVGTTRERVIPIFEQSSGLTAGTDFTVAFAPERTVEGRALEELKTLPQIIGGLNERSSDLAARLFRNIAPAIVNVSSLEAAEMVKLVNNCYRDAIFAFANQISLLADNFNLSTVEIITAANKGYPREQIPRPSPGVGGVCLQKDPYLLAESAARVGAEMPRLTLVARETNERIPDRIAEKVSAFANAHGFDPTRLSIGILGIAFKGRPETSDYRASPAIEVIAALRRRGFSGEFFAHDPLITPSDLTNLGTTPASIDEILHRAHAVLLLTNHSAYDDLNFAGFAGLSNGHRLFFDGWHTYSHSLVEPYGIKYASLGHNSTDKPPHAT